MDKKKKEKNCNQVLSGVWRSKVQVQCRDDDDPWEPWSVLYTYIYCNAQNQEPRLDEKNKIKKKFAHELVQMRVYNVYTYMYRIILYVLRIQEKKKHSSL